MIGIMSGTLQDTLNSYVQSDWQSNPAMQQIITEYGRYHAALAIVGGIFLIILIVASVLFWVKCRRIPKIRRFKWPFDKKVYFGFGLLATLVVLFLALIVAANISTASKPLPGFTGSINTISTSGSKQQLNESINDWIKSGTAKPPVLVQQSIHNRQVFHIKRAVVSSILLGVFTALSFYLWKWLIAKRNVSESKWTAKEAGALVTASMLVLLVLFLMLAVMANLQSVVAPLANTLQFG